MAWTDFLKHLPVIGPIAGAVGTVAGNVAGARGTGRQNEADTNLSRDQLALQAYLAHQNAKMRALENAERGGLDRANLDLDQRQFGLSAPGRRAGNAVRGDILSQATNQTVSHPRAHIPKVSGGFGPSNFTPETRQLGADMTRQALTQQLAGDQFDPLPATDFQGAVTKPPGQTPLPEPGAFDSFLNVVAPVGGVLGGISEAVQGNEERERSAAILDELDRELAQRRQGATTAPPLHGTPTLTPTPQGLTPEELERLRREQRA